MAPVEVGTRFGRYALQGLLGQGGMGRVYRALDTQLERVVALKVLRDEMAPSEETLARFIRESRLGARLTHANTVQVYDAGLIDGTPFIAMEHLEGGSLQERALSENTSTSLKIQWLTEAARGLAAAHDQAILHRDVKPQNILIARDGTAKVSDFGLGKRTETDALMRRTFRTQLGFVVGTPKYMAPEQIEGLTSDPRADQFSWGLTAYYVLTRKHPRDGDLLLVDPPTLASLLVGDVPTHVAEAINRTLSFDRAARFPDMRALGRALVAAIAPAVAAPFVSSPPVAPPVVAPPVIAPPVAAPPVVAPPVVAPPAPREPPRVIVHPVAAPPPAAHVAVAPPPAFVVRPSGHGVVIEPAPSRDIASGVVEKHVSAWRFEREEQPCPIAPISAAAIAPDGKSALAVSARGFARFENGAWNKLSGLPPLGAELVTCVAACDDGAFIFGGARGTAFRLDSTLRGKKWALDLSNADRVTLLAVSAIDSQHATFVGTLGEKGVVVRADESRGARVLHAKRALAGVHATRDRTYVCGSRGFFGTYDERGELQGFEEVNGNLSSIATTEYGTIRGGRRRLGRSLRRAPQSERGARRDHDGHFPPHTGARVEHAVGGGGRGALVAA